MFRNPRENVNISEPQLIKLPSTGRPPTPPISSQTTTTRSNELKTLSTSLLKINNKQETLSKIMVTKRLNSVKTPAKPNTSILKFFKKVDSPIKNDSIFLSSGEQPRYRPPSPKLKYIEENLDDSFEFPHFNEIVGPIKKRKLSNEYTHLHEAIPSKIVDSTPISGNTDTQIKSQIHAEDATQEDKTKSRKIGPFILDSDTDDEADQESPKISSATEKNVNDLDLSQPKISDSLVPEPLEYQSELTNFHSGRPSKKMKSNVVGESFQPDEIIPQKTLNQAENVNSIDSTPVETHSTHFGKEISQNFDDLADFDVADNYYDDFDEGEERAGRNWLEKQAKLEIEETSFDMRQISDEDPMESSRDIVSTNCPVCNADLCGLKTDLASMHVNRCLDGIKTPIPASIINEMADTGSTVEQIKSDFARKSAIPRPGQANPFEIGAKEPKSSSAFSKLMSSKAEDTAWANAAASESSSKGKPAYKRTCPFYKIIPGFSICVDAFRYGAVQGCKAYFLSHFHSDHYIGLSSSWCHGPIYCSKVTANLVKQQLRVDPKFVIPLEFDKKVEVPDTQGVSVSMIPANHCPGSSLFLYEKVIGKCPQFKTYRVLHCGDFRACPAHISHPLLMPDIVDSITGKSKEQKIDVCYLDTTYLNPRYSFPPQEQVIKACAEICLSLRNEFTSSENGLELTKRDAGTCMSKFLKQSTTEMKDQIIKTPVSSTRSRGRLLIVCGTYSIGKERICIGIARALDCKIYAPPRKMRICAALEDDELMSRMTSDPREAQIHLQMLMEIRAETLQEYLNGYKPYFTRIVGFRPSGWTYKPPSSRLVLMYSVHPKNSVRLQTHVF